MITVIGFVGIRNDDPLKLAEPRSFLLETSVYDNMKSGPTSFSVVCFFETTRRWQNVKIPPSDSLITVTAKIAGHMADTNQLALRVLDLLYLLKPSPKTATPSSSTTPISKRPNRWDGRADSTTPSKKPHVSAGNQDSSHRPD